MRKLDLAIVIAGVMSLTIGMTAFAAQSYSEWYHKKFGTWPSGTVLEWENDPVYYSYLDETGQLDNYEKHDPNQDYQPHNSDGSEKNYAYINDAYWNGYSARWDISGYASKYQVRLYKDGSRILTRETSGRKMNFNSYMTHDGDYYFEVRPYNSYAGGWQDWASSDNKSIGTGGTNVYPDVHVDPTYTGSNGYTQKVGQWIVAPDGTGRWMYIHTDGCCTINNWEQINGKWYFFDNQGWMTAGWISWNGGTYYCGVDGVMVTGYNMIDGRTYMFDATGRLIG